MTSESKTLAPLSAEDRHARWLQAQRQQKQDQIDSCAAAIPASFAEWTNGKTPNTSYTCGSSREQFEIRRPPAFDFDEVPGIDTFLEQAAELGYVVDRAGRSTSFAGCGDPVIAIVDQKAVEASQEPSIRPIRPRPLTLGRVAQKFITERARENPDSIEFDGDELGVHLLARTIREIAEAGVCTRIECDGMKGFTSLFRHAYKDRFERAGLSVKAPPHGDTLIVGVDTAAPGAGRITIHLHLSEFISARRSK